MKLAEQLAHARADKVPAGWLTLDQLATAEGRTNSRGHFYYLVAQAVSAGILKKKVFRIVCGRFLRPVPHYFRVR